MGPLATPLTISRKTVEAVHDFEIWSQHQPSQLGRCRLVDGWHVRDRSDGVHPDMFSAFIDIQGDLGPKRRHQGTDHCPAIRRQNADVWAAFDPTTVMAGTQPLQRCLGVFSSNPGDQAAAANSLCGVGSANGIECTVDVRPGKHDWPSAANAFATYLPWLAGQLGTPTAPRIPPGSPTPQPPTIAP
jgi:hypothetical protein